jgi:PrtD family type I secretion system ABC transporter
VTLPDNNRREDGSDAFASNAALRSRLKSVSGRPQRPSNPPVRPQQSAAKQATSAPSAPPRRASRLHPPLTSEPQPQPLTPTPETTSDRACPQASNDGPGPTQRGAETTSDTLRDTLKQLQVDRNGELWAALMESRPALVAVATFSFLINLLMLTGPLFMLQVYDRVMTSGSMPTLVALGALTAGIYAIIGAFELIRSRVVVRIGREFDVRIADRVFLAAMRRSTFGQRTATAALRELDNIRQFVSGPGPLAIFDAPWTPIYLLIVFALHWVLGLAAVAAAIILLTLAYMSERSSRDPLLQGASKQAASLETAEIGQRNAESLLAMGMADAYRNRWQSRNAEALAWQTLAADRLGGVTATTKTLRLAFQSMMLGIGAALALNNEISAGTIVAATIIFGRALAPVEQVLGQWRSLLKAVDSFGKVDDLLKKEPEPAARTQLPRPRGHITVNGLRIASPDTKKLIVANLTFEARPGELLAVIGPSGSGKSTLTRALVGLWPPAAGSIRLDGAALDQWDRDALGQHVGYLPQSVELFSGTVRENISRFRTDVPDAAIIAAAQAAHAHDLILGLPNGYDTELGEFGALLSAGQRQRIALARALFDQPVLVVLDEPNANLDHAGDEALAAAIDGMRRRGQTVVIVSHRTQAIRQANKLLYLDKGLQRAFGPRDSVLAQIKGERSGATQAQQNTTARPPVAPRAQTAPAQAGGTR